MQVTVAEHHELLLLASDGMWSGNNNANFGFRTGEEVVKHVSAPLSPASLCPPPSHPPSSCLPRPLSLLASAHSFLQSSSSNRVFCRPQCWQLRQRLRCNNNNLEEALKSAVDKVRHAHAPRARALPLSRACALSLARSLAPALALSRARALSLPNITQNIPHSTRTRIHTRAHTRARAHTHTHTHTHTRAGNPGK